MGQDYVFSFTLQDQLFGFNMTRLLISFYHLHQTTIPNVQALFSFISSPFFTQQFRIFSLHHLQNNINNTTNKQSNVFNIKALVKSFSSLYLNLLLVETIFLSLATTSSKLVHLTPVDYDFYTK